MKIFKELFKSVVKSDITAFALGLVIILLTFVVSDADSGSCAVTGLGTVLWIALWMFRKNF